MKKKFVVTVLASFVSVASAQTISKGATLLEHKTWTTGGATGHMEYNNVFFSAASAYASATGGTGWVYQNIMSSGNHSINIQNSSKIVQRFQFSYKLCADSNKCIYDSKSYSINPNGSLSDSATSYLTASFEKPGYYDLVATTTVSGDASASDSGSSGIRVRK
ncbi:MAG: hypothetical protein H0U73_06895 [Tatlockia sp.]|nr:hypothetical protein [Tatlockia sp.]